jgi:long-chain acyl-CoA synthetase
MKFGSVIEALAYRAKYAPNKLALIESESGLRCTYADLWNWSCAFAKRLTNAGVKPNFDEYGSRVVVRVGSFINTAVAQLGVYVAGGVYCPVEKNMKPPKMREMLKYYDAVAYVSTHTIDSPAFYLDLDSAIGINEEPGEIRLPKPEDLCAIVFTTGTTGKAKGVMLTHRSLAEASRLHIDIYELTSNDNFFWANPLDRPHGLKLLSDCIMSEATGIHFGGGLVFGKVLIEMLNKYGITVWYMQSYSLGIIFEYLGKSISSDDFLTVRCLIISAGPVQRQMRVQLQKLLPSAKLFSQYATTETSWISCYDFANEIRSPQCVGKPFPEVVVHFTDEQGKFMQCTSEHNYGSVTVESPAVMLGYWKTSASVGESLAHSGLRLTDLGYTDAEGFLYLLGRQDDVIVSGGQKIAPYELEDIALSYEGVSECVCVSADDKVLGKIPKLFIKMKPDAEFNAALIYRHLSERIETFKLPRVICEVDEFPRVPHSHKVNRKRLSDYV